MASRELLLNPLNRNRRNNILFALEVPEVLADGSARFVNHFGNDIWFARTLLNHNCRHALAVCRLIDTDLHIKRRMHILLDDFPVAIRVHPIERKRLELADPLA